jgi:hypothetical protein
MAVMVTLVNRSSKDLTGTWDGKHYVIKPGKHEFPDYKALKFKDQNPVMGSEDVRTGHIDYLIGIVEEGDPIDPIEQNLNAVEKWDRKTLGNARPTEIIPGDNGLYSRNQLAPGPSVNNGPVTTGFDKA